MCLNQVLFDTRLKYHVEDGEDYIGEERRHLYVDCHYLLHQSLSLSLSLNLCNAPILRIQRRYGDVHTRGENMLTRTLSLSTVHNLHIDMSFSMKEVQEYLQKEVSDHNRNE